MREMKDSGITYIGMIPTSWSISRIKNICEFNCPPAINLRTNDIVSYAPMECIRNGYIEPREIRVSDISSGLTCFVDGDIVMAKVTPCFENGNIAIAENLRNGVGFGSSELFTFRKYRVIPRWLFYYLQNDLFIDMARSTFTGTGGLKRVSPTFVNNHFLAIPAKSEQKSIVSFLDEHCSLISSLIKNLNQQIEMLKQYKQSLITEAVTRGLDTSVPMKDSGVEWIGEIPREWKKTTIRYIGSLQNGISKSGDYFGEGYPFVSYGDVYKNFTLPTEVNGRIRSEDKEREIYSVRKGDIFFTRTSETIEEVGFSAVCTQSIENATFAGFVIRLRPFKVDSVLLTEYAKYYFRGNHIRNYLAKEMNLVTRASLGQGLLKSLSVLLPPPKVQEEIAWFLDDKCSKIDRLIQIKEAKIQRLLQYRKSLIYEYVTGKKEVV